MRRPDAVQLSGHSSRISSSNKGLRAASVQMMAGERQPTHRAISSWLNRFVVTRESQAAAEEKGNQEMIPSVNTSPARHDF